MLLRMGTCAVQLCWKGVIMLFSFYVTTRKGVKKQTQLLAEINFQSRMKSTLKQLNT